jgi:dihydrofolate reductase
MRRIVMFNRVSADGYFATPDGKLDWTVPDQDIDKAAMTGGAEYDTILFGHRTYQMFESFWPHVLDDPSTAPDPHAPGRRTPELRAMAEMLNRSKKLVFSRTRQEVTWNNSHIVRELDPRQIEEMKRQSGKDMIIFGSGTIVSQLTERRLIDEYQLIVGPVILGSGRPLFTGVSKHIKLELLEARPYASGNLVLRYAPSSTP